MVMVLEGMCGFVFIFIDSVYVGRECDEIWDVDFVECFFIIFWGVVEEMVDFWFYGGIYIF